MVGESDHDAPGAPDLQHSGAIRNLPIDSELAAAMGVNLQHLDLRFPRDTKLSVYQRIYRNGVLDKVASSIQVHASNMPVSQQYIDLGTVDPDVLTGSESRRMKIFGAVGPLWITIPPELTKGISMTAHPVENLPVGQDHLLFDLSVGHPPQTSSVLMMDESLPEKSALRVTTHVRLDPLSPEEQQQLRDHSNYNAAFRLEK